MEAGDDAVWQTNKLAAHRGTSLTGCHSATTYVSKDSSCSLFDGDVCVCRECSRLSTPLLSSRHVVVLIAQWREVEQ
jgi:hypothetical protein